MTTAIVRAAEARGLEVQNLTDLRALGDLLARSGYFRDARDAAQAAVKVQAGLEIGVQPIQAMTGIHIVEGKPTMSSTLIASLIKRSGRYNYRIVKHDDNECAIAFFENGQQIGVSSFTWADAERAGVTRNPTWGKYRRNMLFARAISNGARWHTPDVFGGAVYTAEELGADVNGDGEPVAQVVEGHTGKWARVGEEYVPAEKLSPATLKELQALALAELDRLQIGAGMTGADLKAARNAAVRRIAGKAPRTAEDWQAVVESLEAEPTPATIDGADGAQDSAA